MLRATAKWPIWRQPPVALALILAVDLSAVLIPASFWQAISRSDVEIAVALGTLSIAYSTYTCSAERVRRTLHQGPEAARYSNLLAIWGFTAAVLLPLELMWVVAVAGAVAEWPARRVAGRARLYRHIYSTGGAVLAATAAHAMSSSGLSRWLGIALAALIYIAVGALLILAAMLAAGEWSAARAFLQPSPYRVEICCLAIAVGIVALVDARLGMLVWLSLPAAIGLQRTITRTRLRDVADDALLRPMGEEAWSIAATEVVAALPVVAIIRITTTDPSRSARWLGCRPAATRSDMSARTD